ncbi:2-hydroxyacid dehydrogenase [Flavobacterium glaciei]|uniref:D-lactate dehydrogenase n=1 Tax=Flavobacterium glaciei TaxID=386300 RepID=A0A562PP71_9FLAO|nr:2-hydroxyacid dehydrogenase [Flavobacterium glaciei]RDI52499.1 D-lactate dehydrogenase [Flavobacterium glaciei]TWI46247.1 D-lactate dehydrogenase [Flavobacterium glaciei]
MKTLVYSILGFDKAFLEKESHGNQELVFTEQFLNENTALLAKGFDAVSLFTSDDASEKVLQKLSTYGVKYIALRSVGYDHVDLTKAKSLGMKVANVPEYSPNAIAELAVALILALNRKLVLGQSLMQTGDYRLDHLVGFDLHGKTIGIVGTGKIGAAFAKIMNGFGCKIIAFDIKENKELMDEIPLTYVSLEDLCATADVISVHYLLNAKTTHLFNKSTFALMKKGVIFINTARGGIVNTKDLIEAIENKTIGAAGLDVYEKEKPIFFLDHTDTPIKDDLFLKLRSHPNVMITGHQGFLTNEALKGITHTTIANLNAWDNNGISENEVN